MTDLANPLAPDQRAEHTLGGAGIYAAFGRSVAADLILPLVPASPSAEADCHFALLSPAAQDPRKAPWLSHWRSVDGVPWLSFGSRLGGYLLRFHGMADYLVSADGRDIKAIPVPGIPRDTVQHLLVDQVLPLAFAQSGELLLHSGAVVLGEEAVAFIGESGKGKSTLVTAFGLQGYPVLSDDCFLLEAGPQDRWAVPGYPGLRLWPDAAAALLGPDHAMPRVAHYTIKRRIGGDYPAITFAGRPARLRRVYVLDVPHEDVERRDPQILPISAAEALFELVKASYILDITDRRQVQANFERLSELAELPLFRRLVIPRGLDLLPAVIDAVVDDATRSSSLPRSTTITS